MITVHISGGLGNQFFQYSAGRALAEKIDTELKLDLRVYSNKRYLREYSLDNFEIKAKTSISPKIDYVQYMFNRWLPIRYKTRIYGERQFSYDSNFDKLNDSTYLLGHWQSEKYFKRISNQIRRELQYKQRLNDDYIKYKRMIYASNSVSLHIRRGDYVSNSNTNSVHGTCTLDYYYHALDIVSSKLSKPHVFVFSDDINWARKNCKFKTKTTFVTTEKPDANQEIEIMKHCKHSIIANSSYSWWGAWLNEYKGKIVIAPDKWFNDQSLDTTDLIPQRWLRVK
ncbi:MAG: alpha-1,2-fucosyltransferase [Candidatus Microgenomates bacterium]